MQPMKKVDCAHGLYGVPEIWESIFIFIITGMEPFSFIHQALALRKASGQLRTLKDLEPLPGSRVRYQGKELINLSSNDYLGLAEHPLLSQRAASYMTSYGAGSKASRLVSGNIAPFGLLEERLARLKGQEASLILNAGFQANSSLPGLFVGKGDLILMDRLIHNSLIQGASLSGARLQRFGHNDLVDLETKLQQARSKSDRRILVLTESVFSMDGDLADLAQTKALCDRHQAMLLVDEAHATGVMGQSGMGLTNGLGIDLVMGTFGKGLGSFGAYFACPEAVKQYAINFAPAFIYTTALPPQVLGAIDAALELVPQMETERKQLHDLAELFRKEAGLLGYDCMGSQSQIIPILMGEEERAVGLMEHLLERGFLAVAIRPPTVEQGRSRVRFALNSLLKEEQIHQLLEALHDFPK